MTWEPSETQRKKKTCIFMKFVAESTAIQSYDLEKGSISVGNELGRGGSVVRSFCLHSSFCPCVLISFFWVQRKPLWNESYDVCSRKVRELFYGVFQETMVESQRDPLVSAVFSDANIPQVG
jgi:hypothetical protein